MGETSGSSAKVFVLLRHDIGKFKTTLSMEVGPLLEVYSSGKLHDLAIAKRCQVITYDEESHSGPSASFLATAAYAGYRLAFVVGDMTDAAAGIQQLLHREGIYASTCKVLRVQPGREALVAAAVLAPFLLEEAILGPGQPKNAAAAKQVRPAQLQGQQADGQGPVPLMLPAPPMQEAADASSGQTQHFPNGTPQHEPNKMQRGDAAEGTQKDAEGAAGLGASPAHDSRPAVQKRGRRAQKAEQKAAEGDRAQLHAKRNCSAAALGINERSKPASEALATTAAKRLPARKRARKSKEAPEDMGKRSRSAEGPSDAQLKGEIEKILDGSDVAFSMNDLLTELQRTFKVSLSMRKPFLKQLAASYLADKQERKDAGDSAAEKVAVALRQPVKGAKAGKLVPSPAEAPLQQPGAQAQQEIEVVDLISDSDDGMSCMPASQAALQDDGISARSEGCRKQAPAAPAVRVRKSARISSQCSSGASDGETERESKRSKAWLAGCKKRSKAAPAQPEVPQRKRSRLGSGQEASRQLAAASTGNAGPVAAGAAPAGNRATAEPPYSSQARRHERAESQAACPGPASPNRIQGLPANEVPRPGTQGSPGEAAGNFVTPAKQKAGTPSQAAAQSQEPAGQSPNDTPSKAVLPFSQKVIGGLLEQFKQNRIQCSQASPSPGKGAKWKGKEKTRELEEPRDPEQPGPSNAVYRSAPQEAALVDSDDESIVLSEPLI